MAILANMGQRGFVLKEGMLNPGSTITVDQETAEKLSRAYPKELKVIVPDAVVEAPAKEPEVVAPVVEAPKEEPKKRGRKPKAK